MNDDNNNSSDSSRLVTLEEHASDHGKQTNSNTSEWGENYTSKELLLKT